MGRGNPGGDEGGERAPKPREPLRESSPRTHSAPHPDPGGRSLILPGGGCSAGAVGSRWQGNGCSLLGACRELVVGALPHLLQLDTRPLRGCTDPAPGEEEEEEGSSSSEDDEELFSEPSAPFTADKGARAEAGHGLCGGEASQSPCPQGWQQGQGALVAVPGPAVILPPPGQISLQTFTGSWPGAPGGGRGRPWRNTGAACRGCGGCCCPPRRAQRAPRPAEPPAPGRGSGPRPQAGSAPSPHEAGAAAMSPPGRAGRPPPAASASRSQPRSAALRGEASSEGAKK